MVGGWERLFPSLIRYVLISLKNVRNKLSQRGRNVGATIVLLKVFGADTLPASCFTICRKMRQFELLLSTFERPKERYRNQRGMNTVDVCSSAVYYEIKGGNATPMRRKKLVRIYFLLFFFFKQSEY
jgi:hypothetical protein